MCKAQRICSKTTALKIQAFSRAKMTCRIKAPKHTSEGPITETSPFEAYADRAISMPTFHRATTLQFKLLTSTSLRDTLRDYRKSPVTRFITDANIEPWALHVMRYKHLDFLDCDSAGIRTFDDHAVFAEAWRLKRLLVTHDSDFLDDRQFPFSRCPGCSLFSPLMVE